MSKELQRHEGVYTKTSGTCGALSDVNTMASLLSGLCTK